MLKQTLYLKAGGFLEIHDGYARFVNRDGREIPLTNAQQTILSMLVQAQGSPVPYELLYERYSGQAAMGNVNQCLTKVRNRIGSAELKDCIRAVSGVGYRLDLAQFTAQPPAAEQQPAEPDDVDGMWVQYLAGDYYGFYLDPIGDGSILGAYFRIEEYHGEVIVNAILGIQSDEVLRSEKLAVVFSGAPERYRQNYRELIQEFSDNDRRCFYGSGKVMGHNSDAIITLSTSLNAMWTILVEASLFQEGVRINQGHHHQYRGGMGIIIALADARCKFCARFGLVRREYMQPAITLDNPQMRETLKIFSSEEENGSCQPLKLGIDLDRKWYNWFMKGAK